LAVYAQADAVYTDRVHACADAELLAARKRDQLLYLRAALLLERQPEVGS